MSDFIDLQYLYNVEVLKYNCQYVLLIIVSYVLSLMNVLIGRFFAITFKVYRGEMNE